MEMYKVLLLLIKEFYQMAFIASIIFLFYKIILFVINIYKNYKFEQNNVYKSNKYDKLLFWITLTIILSFLI